jgi:hypothetical protein
MSIAALCHRHRGAAASKVVAPSCGGAHPGVLLLPEMAFWSWGKAARGPLHNLTRKCVESVPCPGPLTHNGSQAQCNSPHASSSARTATRRRLRDMAGRVVLTVPERCKRRRRSPRTGSSDGTSKRG